MLKTVIHLSLFIHFVVCCTHITFIMPIITTFGLTPFLSALHSSYSSLYVHCSTLSFLLHPISSSFHSWDNNIICKKSFYFKPWRLKPVLKASLSSLSTTPSNFSSMYSHYQTEYNPVRFILPKISQQNQVNKYASLKTTKKYMSSEPQLYIST